MHCSPLVYRVESRHDSVYTGSHNHCNVNSLQSCRTRTRRSTSAVALRDSETPRRTGNRTSFCLRTRCRMKTSCESFGLPLAPIVGCYGRGGMRRLVSLRPHPRSRCCLGQSPRLTWEQPAVSRFRGTQRRNPKAPLSEPDASPTPTTLLQIGPPRTQGAA